MVENNPKSAVDGIQSMRAGIQNWMFNGERGMSSDAIAGHMLGYSTSRSHPYDPDDFRRCLLLLEQVPEIRSHLYRMGEVSAAWKRLVDKWDEIEQSFLQEVGLFCEHGDSAPKTYAMMKAIVWY